MLYDLRGIGSRGLLPVKIGPVIAKEIAVITSIIVIAKIVIVGIIKVIIVAVFIAVVAQPVLQLIQQRAAWQPSSQKRDDPDEEQRGLGQQHAAGKAGQLGVAAHAARPHYHKYKPNDRHHRQQNKPHIGPHAQSAADSLFRTLVSHGIAFAVGAAVAAVRTFLARL